MHYPCVETKTLEEGWGVGARFGGGVIGNRKRFPAAVFVELNLMPWVPSALVEEGEDYGWDLTPGVTVVGF